MVYDFDKLAKEAQAKVENDSVGLKDEPQEESAQTTEAQGGADEPSEEQARGIPYPLQTLRVKQTYCAIAIAVITVIALFVTREPRVAVLLLLSLYMLWLRWKVSYDWEHGRIQEEVLVCTQVVHYTKTTMIVCRNEDMVYSFTIPKKTQAYIEGATYVFWWHEDRPHVIMAYQPL